MAERGARHGDSDVRFRPSGNTPRALRCDPLATRMALAHKMSNTHTYMDAHVLGSVQRIGS